MYRICIMILFSFLGIWCSPENTQIKKSNAPLQTLQVEQMFSSATGSMWPKWAPEMTRETQESCEMFDDFSQNLWTNRYVINDGVMGGLSKWNLVLQDDTLIFSGNINTNGGGFTSIRKSLSPQILSEIDFIKLTLKGDSRSYKMTFRDSYSTWISYQADIPSQKNWDLEEISIPLSKLQANYFGRSIKTRAFRKDQALELGFIISDWVDWPFQIEIKNIKFCKNSIGP